MLLPKLYEYPCYQYIVKTDKDLNVKWSKSIKGRSLGPKNILIDQKNDLIILVNNLNNSINIQIDTMKIISPSNENHMMVAKFDSSGVLMWKNFIEIGYNFNVTDMKVSKNNNIFIAGFYSGFSSFYNSTKIDTSAGNTYESNFFAKYDENGRFEWVKTFPEDGYSIQTQLRSIDNDSNENVYVTGWWYGNGSINSIYYNFTSPWTYIAKFNSSRHLLWLKQIDKTNSYMIQSGNDIAVDEPLNRFYVTGGFLGTADFGGRLLNANDQNIFLASYSLEGNLIWVKNMGYWSGAASGVEHGHNLFIDKDGSVYLSGDLGKNGNFDGISISAYDNPANSNLYHDPFIARFTSNGRLLWVTHIGHPDKDDLLYDMKKTIDNKLMIVGESCSNAIFGEHIFANNYSPLGYICQLSDSTVITNSPNSSHSNSLTIYPNPVVDYLIFNYPITKGEPIFNISISDVTGRKVIAKEITVNYINISELKSGLYIFVLECDGIVLSKKFIKV